MLFTLVSLSFCLKPVFFAPGMTVSPLYATIISSEKFPECEGFELNHTKLWPVKKEMNECVSAIVDTVYHPENDTFSHPDGVLIETDPISKANPGQFLKWHNNTWTVFYDWTLYYLGIQNTFEELKNSIENEVNSSHEKAVLIGYSLGTSFMRYFSTEYVSKDWLITYIDGIQFIAPGIQGTFSSVKFVTTNNLQGTEGIFVRHMSSQWVMFPNFNLYTDCIYKNNTLLGADQIYSEMKKAGYIDDMCEAVYQAVKPFLEKEIPDPGIRTSFIYNDGIPVMCGVNAIDDGENETYEEIMCSGDGALETKGAEYACNHFSNVQCYNFQTNDTNFNHFKMGDQATTLELVMKFVLNEIEPTKNHWFSGTTKICIIVAISILALIIIIIMIVCIVKRKKRNSKYSNLNNTL